MDWFYLENLHETMDFPIVYGAFRLKLFPRKPIHWYPTIFHGKPLYLMVKTHVNPVYNGNGSPLPSSAPSSPRWRAAVPTWRTVGENLPLALWGMGYRTPKQIYKWWLGESFLWQIGKLIYQIHLRSIVFLKLSILFAHSFLTISANMKPSLTRIYSNSWMIWVPTQARMDESRFCSKILMQGSRAGWCWLLLWNAQFCWTGLFSYVSSFLRVHVLLLAYLSAHLEPKPGDVFPWPPVGTSW